MTAPFLPPRSPHRLRRPLRVAALSITTLAVAACGGSTTSPGGAARTPALNLTPCTVASVSARCGSLTVAENPAAPNGRQIHLRVVVRPAQGSVRAPDPLLYLAGYGGAASDDVAWATGTFTRLNQTRDIVFVDQRGTGGSNRMECSGLQTLGTSLDDAAIGAAVDDCLARVSRQGDPRYYTTPLAVDDVDRVRAALGYDMVNIYGGSYGVSSGLAYVQRHGAHVRAAVFDSGSLLDVRLWERAAGQEQQALDQVLARCAAETGCSHAYPDVAGELRAVLRRLAASPVHVDVVDPRTRASVPVSVSTDVFLSFVADRLQDVGTAATLPAAIHAAFTGAWASLVERYTTQQAAGGTDPRVTLVSSRTIGCSDEWARMDPGRAAAAGSSSLFTPVVVAEARGRSLFCSHWPVAEGASGVVRSDAPIVFLNGTADTADPPANVAAARATMPHSLSVAVRGYGHGQLSQDASAVLAAQAMTFLQFGRPSTPEAWAMAQNPPFPAFR